MHMHLWQSIPFACIILPLGCAAVTSIMKPRMARIWATAIISIVTVLSAVITGVLNGIIASHVIAAMKKTKLFSPAGRTDKEEKSK